MLSVFDKTGLAFVNACLRDEWTTPKSSSSNRHAEISAWLAKHPDVKNYLILDDLNSGHTLHGADLHPRTIFCGSTAGLDDEYVLEAVRILSRANDGNSY